MTGVPALAAATASDAQARVPFTVDGRGVGSVAREHLALLASSADWLQVGPEGVSLPGGLADRDAALARLHDALRAAGGILAWRDEIFPLFDPHTLQELAHIERAATRFWGSLTLGAHATGFVAGGDGRPRHLWIARRSASKATDPGCFDNLVGGGVPAGQSAAEALVREAWEEAGLEPGLAKGARAAGVLRLRRDIPEGLQHEWLYAYDLELPAGWVPRNQDGEVAAFTLMPVADALALACGRVAGPAMTVDAALVTIDFALRHALLLDADLAAAVQRLRVVRSA